MIKVGTLLSLLCLLDQDPSETNQLIKSLSSDSSEARDKAQDRLVQLGSSALPALREAVSTSKDPETVSRAKDAIEDIERLENEQRHDDQEKTRLLAKRKTAPDAEEAKLPNHGGTEAAVFGFFPRVFKGGIAVKSWATDYLSPGNVGHISFDIDSVTNVDGKLLEVERCGLCSPAQVYAKDASGPIRVRVKGKHLWFSPYQVEFENPKQGDRKKIGNFILIVDWPVLKIRSRKGWPEEVGNLFETKFTYELKNGEPQTFMGARTGAGGGGSSSTRWPDSWCQCKDGPKPMVEKPKLELHQEFAASPRGNAPAIEKVSRILYVFLKPVEEPFDFTAEVTPKK